MESLMLIGLVAVLTVIITLAVRGAFSEKSLAGRVTTAIGSNITVRVNTDTALLLSSSKVKLAEEAGATDIKVHLADLEAFNTMLNGIANGGAK